MGGEEAALAATEQACRVYVGNLLPKAKEIHLTSKFSRFGTIHSVWIARRPPGFAFVRFASPEAAQRAVEACGEEGAMEILGKAVRVQMAGDKGKEKDSERSRSPRRGRERSRSRSPRHREHYRRRYSRSRSSSRSRSRRRSRRSRSRSGSRGRRRLSRSASRRRR